MNCSKDILGLNKKQMKSLLRQIEKVAPTYHVQRGTTTVQGRIIIRGNKVELIVDRDTHNCPPRLTKPSKAS